jgi:hypothetical protein
MIGRRLYAWIIDTFLFLVLLFFVDGLIATPIMNKTTNIEKVLDSYVINSDIYNDLQDEYELYIYVDNQRVQNESISEEVKQDFLNDSRVIEITNTLYYEQTILLKTMIVRLSLSILAVSLIVYILFPLLFNRGRTLGKVIAKLSLNKNNEYAKWYLVAIRYLLSIIFNIYLAIISLGIIPLINLLLAINHRENRAIYDMILGINVEDNKLPIEIINQR